jgi:hypothetical protein
MLRSMIVGFIALLGVLNIHAGDSGGAVAIPGAAAPPLIDGRLDDKCWADASGIAFRPIGGEAADSRHKAWLATDGKWLHAAFDVALPADRDELTFERHDDKLHREEHVLLSIDPVGDGKKAYHFWLNANNVRAESKFTVKGKAGTRGGTPRGSPPPS